MKSWQVNNMKLGISLYPDLQTVDEINKKLQIASENGVELIFTSIQLDTLNFDGANAKWSTFKDFFLKCKKMGFKVSVDVSRDSISKFKITDISDLSNVEKLGIYSLRIDGGYSTEEIAAFTRNKQHIKIEINASMTSNIDQFLELISKKGNISNVLACHNFFPKKDTGLGWGRFEKYNAIIRKYNLEIGAFITTKNSKGILSRNSTGVPTIESHRGQNVGIQINDFKAHNIDYVIFSEPEFSSSELVEANKALSDEYIVIYLENICDKESFKKISKNIFTFRPDQPEWLLRCSERIGEIKPITQKELSKFSVTIDNSLNGRYSGEINILLKDFEKKKYINKVGEIISHQYKLLENDLLINKKIIFKEKNEN